MLRIVFRTLMRRAYNSGDWENARKYALKIIKNPKEEKLAKSVILRSYWNQKDLLKLEIYLEKWGDIDFEDIRENSVQRTQKQVIPSPNFEIDWNPTDIPANFVQEGTSFDLRHQIVGFTGNA